MEGCSVWTISGWCMKMEGSGGIHCGWSVLEVVVFTISSMDVVVGCSVLTLVKGIGGCNVLNCIEIKVPMVTTLQKSLCNCP